MEGLVDDPAAPAKKTDPGHVLHSCDNRPCCNPGHFFLGTYGDNQIDAYAKGRRAQPQGEHHANAKLTYDQAAEIRKRYSEGEKQVPLSKEYNVTQRVISLIVRGESYR